MKQYLISIIFAVVMLAGCSAQMTTTPGPVNLQTNLENVSTYYAKGQYDRDILNLMIDADAYLAKTLKSDKFDKPAIIFDIDDTLLNNYPFFERNGFLFRKHLWEQWVNMGNIPPIQPIQSLYAKYTGRVDIFIITGRNILQKAQTLRNLRNAGYTDWTGILFKEAWDRDLKATEYKSKVIKQLIAKEGYQIIANFGDQASDFGVEIPGREFRLPNYLYVTK